MLAFANFPVYRIHGGGMNANQHVIDADAGSRRIFIMHDVRSSKLVDTDTLHGGVDDARPFTPLFRNA
jgi:hypothetical protein